MGCRYSGGGDALSIRGEVRAAPLILIFLIALPSVLSAERGAPAATEAPSHQRTDERGRKQGYRVEKVGERGWQTHEGRYRDGLKEGPWRVYGGGQKLICEETFVHGILDGPFISYSVDGRLAAVVNYREGKRHGTARFHYGDGLSLLVIYDRGAERARQIVAADGTILKALPPREGRPVVSADNWQQFWKRLDAKAPRRFDVENRGSWSLRVVLGSFNDARRYLNPHLLSDVEGDLFRDMLSRFGRSVRRGMAKGWCTVLREIGCELSEEETIALENLLSKCHENQSSFDGAWWDEERKYHAGLYRGFLETVQERFSAENFALLCIFLESVNMTTRPKPAAGGE